MLSSSITPKTFIEKVLSIFRFTNRKSGSFNGMSSLKEFL